MLRTVRALVGLVLVAAGVLLLAEQVGGATKAVHLAGRWWPLAVLALGLAYGLTFAGAPFRQGSGRALPLAALGLLLLLATGLLFQTTGQVPRGLPRFLPGVALVAAGAVLVTLQGSPDRRYQTWVSVIAVLRRVRLASRGRALRLVAARALLGQVALDLTAATLEPGGAEIQATVFWGRVLLRLPAGWQVVPGPVMEPTLELVVPPADPALPKVPMRSVPLNVTGLHGRVEVEWASAPVHLLAP